MPTRNGTLNNPCSTSCTDECKEILSSNCIIYNGENLSNIDIVTGDYLNTVLENLNTSVTPFTADNALTKNTATNVQLGSTTTTGSPLLHHTFINDDIYNFYFYKTVASDALNIINSSSTGVGLQSTTSGGIAGSFTINPSSQNTVETAIKILRTSQLTATNGIGVSIDFYNETLGVGSLNELSNKVVSKWSVAANASRTSEYEIWGTLNTVNTLLLILGQSGLILPQYGSGTLIDNTKYLLGVMSDGTIAEASFTAYADDVAAGVGGLTTGQLYQTTGSGAAPLNVAGILMVKQ